MKLHFGFVMNDNNIQPIGSFVHWACLYLNGFRSKCTENDSLREKKEIQNK